ncbi:hypothetical protein AMELA_G00227890 [Ameiurus melas]|uniref:Uncharacterized protein n=1 Tax=Ameiurus melas TaxID=219545 RepID=A0A7J6A217_AMEME|nr:hypothetical protein AMELA_G00227890 [Ameiurus melas]
MMLQTEALPPKPAPSSVLAVSVPISSPPPTDIAPPMTVAVNTAPPLPIFPSSLTIPPSLAAPDLAPPTAPPTPLNLPQLIALPPDTDLSPTTTPPLHRVPPQASTPPQALTLPSALSSATTLLPLPLAPESHALIFNPISILTLPSSSTSQSALETHHHLSGESLHPQQMTFDLGPNIDLHLDLDPPVGGADLCKGAADEASDCTGPAGVLGRIVGGTVARQDQWAQCRLSSDRRRFTLLIRQCALVPQSTVPTSLPECFVLGKWRVASTPARGTAGAPWCVRRLMGIGDWQVWSVGVTDVHDRINLEFTHE